MSITIHVPKGFTAISDIETYISENNLSYTYLVPGSSSLSFQVFGQETDLNNFTSFLAAYEVNGIAPVGISSTQPSHKTHITTKRLAPNISLEKKDNTITPKTSSSASLPYFTAKQLGSIYQINTSTPTSRVGVAIIELGGGYNSSDLSLYWSYLGLITKPNVYSISVDGGMNLSPSSHPTDADFEVALDIEMVGGICPNSNIYVYFAPNTNQGFYDAIHAAIYSTQYPVSMISISWGAPENEWSSADLQSFNTLLYQASLKGITVSVAAGDNGSGDGESGLHVDFPSSSPYALSCGGTRLVCPSQVYATSTTKETVWGPNDNGASGGGFSLTFNRPVWQIGVTPANQTKRGVPDIVADAAPDTGEIIGIFGQFYVVGGTSAVAPLISGYLATLNNKQFVSPILYYLYSQVNRNIIHAITSGSDGAYSGGAGWTPAAGLGSPNGNVLSPLLKLY